MSNRFAAKPLSEIGQSECEARDLIPFESWEVHPVPGKALWDRGRALLDAAGEAEDEDAYDRLLKEGQLLIAEATSTYADALVDREESILNAQGHTMAREFYRSERFDLETLAPSQLAATPEAA